jgi:hypothetical protein
MFVLREGYRSHLAAGNIGMISQNTNDWGVSVNFAVYFVDERAKAIETVRKAQAIVGILILILFNGLSIHFGYAVNQ